MSARPIYTQSQLDTVVARAVAAAKTAPAAAPTASAPSATDAVKAERDRIAAINALPEAKGREGLAMTLATSTDMSVDQVRAALAAAPTAAADGARDSEIGLLWDQVLSSKGMTDGAAAQAAATSAAATSWDPVLASRGVSVN
ncbi:MULTISPECIES: hypothetical protein [unclassified Bradyrhizobium]|uniref:hypothetical protein n=1 Tax=unclassified Bradyrhizobium TaxID=2631580 RepID=UPI002916C09B|nr:MULTISPECIES: hypothetical protein [unclassified Bradyrhizobium]